MFRTMAICQGIGCGTGANKPEGYNPLVRNPPRYGGRTGAKFYREGMSMQYAGGIVKKGLGCSPSGWFGSGLP